ncbi:hypothetical protein [Rhizobium leguminosarum]|uniref:hypothetical protein n=1 Tax=Rhizobium leguminosarum TaxID=384 RepID=UPI0010312C2E|nr:hypothetical protein [Rhizobium leguminosarum]TBG55694.1 hypothetical protein ELG74_30540 [Rhizobium leguminosarum]
MEDVAMGAGRHRRISPGLITSFKGAIVAKMTRFTHIQQSSSTGCGIACLAMVGGISLEEAAVHLFGDTTPDTGRTLWGDMRKGLRAVGLEGIGNPTRVSAWHNIHGVALVAVSRTKENWHWIIYDAFDDLLYDPLRTGPIPAKTSRRKLVSYLLLRRSRYPIPRVPTSNDKR